MATNPKGRRSNPSRVKPVANPGKKAKKRNAATTSSPGTTGGTRGRNRTRGNRRY